MANVGTQNFYGPTHQLIGIPGVDAGDVVAELENAERYNRVYFMTSAGLVDVDVSQDGTNFAEQVAFEDLHSVAPATRVIVTVNDLIYLLEGTFKTVRFAQSGATAVADFVAWFAQAGRGT